MSRIRDAIFGACVTIVLASSIVNAASAEIAGDTGPKNSYLEGRVYQMRPDFTVERFADHAYQNEFEQFAADSVPCRNAVLLGNAWLQHLGITSANAAFGYPAYPTFFGSEYLESPGYGAIIEYPSSKQNVTSELLNRSLVALEESIGRHAGIHWHFALVDRSRNAVTNPAHTLVTQHADYEYYRSMFLDKLPASCPYIDLSYANAGAYFERYYRTDHHWNIAGSLDGYRKIMDALGREPLDGLEQNRVLESPFYGSEARSGLSTAYFDAILDIDKPDADLRLTVDGKKEPLSWLNEGFAGNESAFELEDTFANAYAEWFHDDAGYIHIQNPAGKGSLLIVGDSFTNTIDYLFAYSYRDVHILDPRHHKGSLDAFLEKHAVDDALLLMGSNTLVNVKTVEFLAR